MSAKKKPILFLCAACGEPFTSWAAAEKHNPNHTRIVTTLTQNEAEATRPLP